MAGGVYATCLEAESSLRRRSASDGFDGGASLSFFFFFLPLLDAAATTVLSLGADFEPAFAGALALAFALMMTSRGGRETSSVDVVFGSLVLVLTLLSYSSLTRGPFTPTCKLWRGRPSARARRLCACAPTPPGVQWLYCDVLYGS